VAKFIIVGLCIDRKANVFGFFSLLGFMLHQV